MNESDFYEESLFTIFLKCLLEIVIISCRLVASEGVISANY